ncbi:SpoIIE family protein phosphatase [Streptomyces sp. NPDC003697]
MLFGHARAVFALLSGPAHVLEVANPTFFAAIGGGDRERTGVPLGDPMPELAGQGFLGRVTPFPCSWTAGTPSAVSTCRAALLGVGIDPQVSPCRLLLRPHESLLLCTDGITECRTPTGPEQYGDDRLARALASAPRRPSAHDLLRAVAGDVHSFTGGGDVDDDQAALVITAR